MVLQSFCSLPSHHNCATDSVFLKAAALADLLLTQQELVSPRASTFYCSMSLSAHITARCGSSISCVCFRYLSVLRSSLTAPHGGIALTTRAFRSQHYTLSNSYKMVRAPRLCSHWPPLCRHWPPYRRLTTLRPQAPCPAHTYHTVPSAHKFLRAPTRNVTGEAMPTSLAEAVTQLSFLEFLQRCNLLIAPLQPPQLPAPISLLDAAVQTTSPSDASHHVSTQTSDQPVSSFSFDEAVQTSFHSVHTSSLDAALQTLPHSAASQDVSAQTCARPVASLSLEAAVQTPLHSVVAHDVSTQLPLMEFLHRVHPIQ